MRVTPQSGGGKTPLREDKAANGNRIFTEENEVNEGMNPGKMRSPFQVFVCFVSFCGEFSDFLFASD
jgi:hypothetical protein